MPARAVPADRPPASVLIAAMEEEIATIYGEADRQMQGFAVGAAQMAPPHGAFVVLFDADDRALAGGGVKRLADGLGEIKRMYVVPGARGRGVARRLLAELETAARELGFERVRLDTGPDQPHARSLYVSAGYAEIADYNGNPYAAFWGEKRLSGSR